MEAVPRVYVQDTTATAASHQQQRVRQQQSRETGARDRRTGETERLVTTEQVLLLRGRQTG